jgi:hypothetical protein
LGDGGVGQTVEALALRSITGAIDGAFLAAPP